MIDYHNLNYGVSQLTSLQYLADHPQRNASPVSNLITVTNICLPLNYAVFLRYFTSPRGSPDDDSPCKYRYRYYGNFRHWPRLRCRELSHHRLRSPFLPASTAAAAYDCLSAPVSHYQPYVPSTVSFLLRICPLAKCTFRPGYLQL